MIPNLFLYENRKSKKRRYYWNGERKCFKCGKPADVWGRVAEHFVRGKLEGAYFFCPKHVAMAEWIAEPVGNTFRVLLKEPPKDAFPVPHRYPGMVVSKADMSVFDASYSADGARVIDRTQLSGKSRPVEIEYIGKPLLSAPEEEHTKDENVKLPH